MLLIYNNILLNDYMLLVQSNYSLRSDGIRKTHGHITVGYSVLFSIEVIRIIMTLNCCYTFTRKRVIF